ncbi:MAG: hypothetical protein D6690_08480 [Nitrospirae bacterium]|nr:MAG: hypothetical protein D6690_08480 [Nitrospirota bacterium]
MKYPFTTCILLGLAFIAGIEKTSAFALEPIETFVERLFIHGVPYRTASRYTDADATKLETRFQQACLSQRVESPFCSNMAVTLGILAKPSSIPLMRSFIDKPRTQMELPEFRAQTSAVIALGYAINKTDDSATLDLLERRLWPSDWQPVLDRISLHTSLQLTHAQLATELQRATIIGLALSGHEQAMHILRDLLTNDAIQRDRGLRFLVQEALSANHVIAASGLVCYYAGNIPACHDRTDRKPPPSSKHYRKMDPS